MLVDYVGPIITAITALAGGAIGAWWKTRDLNRQIAADREQARIDRQYPSKHEWYMQYDIAAGRVLKAIGDLQNQRRHNAGQPDGIDLAKTEDRLLTEVISAAGQLEVAAEYLDLIARKEIMTKVNEVSRQIGPAIGRDDIPSELSLPMQEVHDLMREDLGADQ